MGKIVLLLLCLCLLCPVSAGAAEAPQYVALAFRGCPAGAEGEILLEGLAARNIRATFFLGPSSWEQGQMILNGGHEIGLQAREDWNRLSRRAINGELQALRAMLPRCRTQQLLAGGPVSDGLRQVAAAQKMVITTSAVDIWQEYPGGKTTLQWLQSGDILLLEGDTPVNLVLNLLDVLRIWGFRPVMVSERNRRNFGTLPG